MRWCHVSLTCLLLAAPASASDPFEHSEWTALLEAHVDAEGWVDYAGFQADRNALDRYLGELALVSPETGTGSLEQRTFALAYWINAYNALVIRGVLDRGIDTPTVWGDGFLGLGFFTADRGVLGGLTYDLKRLEDDVIRGNFLDPRIHSALNCASISCPRLSRSAFEGATVDQQLDAAMREFVNDPRNCSVDRARGRATLSKIFDWFEKDFLAFEKENGASHPSVLGYLNRFRSAAEAIPLSFRIDYRRYDKRLNRQDH